MKRNEEGGREDISDIRASIPSGTVLECPRCGEENHRILKGKVAGKKGETIECTVKCSKCGGVRKTILRQEKPILVKMIVSEEDKSVRKETELLPSEEMLVGDRLMVDGLEVKVSSIESDGKRVQTAPAKDIDTLWAKRADKVKVKFSIGKGPKTISKELIAQPDEEFFVGDMVEIGRMKVTIHKIKCKDGLLRKGGAEASQIVRIYAKAIKETWA